MKNWYQVLAVSQQATAAEIKAAYRKLAKENHPDAFPDDAVRAEWFKEVSEAYSILSDPEKRGKHDQELQTAAAKSDGKKKTRKMEQDMSDLDFGTMDQAFERFFGFNRETKEIVNEEKLKPGTRTKNPLDATELFEKFMGIKR